MPFATHVLVPTDFSTAAGLAVSAAAVLGKELGAKVTAVHVHDPSALRPPANLGYSPKQQQDLDHEVEAAVTAELEKLRAGPLAGVAEVETVVLRDESAAHAITRYAETVGADLIVIATHGRTGLKQLLIGSVAERVVRQSTVPVLSLRSKLDD